MVVTSCFYGSGAYFSLSLDDASACWGIIISNLSVMCKTCSLQHFFFEIV